VQETDINTDELPEHVVHLYSERPDAQSGSVVFYKQGGKYTIILGKETAKKEMASPKYKGVIQGKLISSVVLKKARVEEAVWLLMLLRSA